MRFVTISIVNHNAAEEAERFCSALNLDDLHLFGVALKITVVLLLVLSSTQSHHQLESV